MSLALANGRVAGRATDDRADDAFFDELEREEFGHLAAHDEAYLDHAGAALCGASQIRAHDELLRSRLYGNPHSAHRPSREASAAIDAARRRLLRFLNTSEATHDVVFTANASAALRLVGESFPFGPRRGLVLAADNHNSVNGIAARARRAGAPVRLLPLTPDLRLDDPEARLREYGDAEGALLALPAQSNFSGVRHPLRIVDTAADLGYSTVLDAAAFVPTTPLDLSRVPVDFVALSFYKMFGFPTGVGALVARHEALARLERPGFAGGTVLYASPSAGRHLLRPGHDGFEDGTLNFLGIAALEAGFALLDRIGLARLGRRVTAFTARFLSGASHLRHGNGAPLVRVHGPRGLAARGGTVAFNLLDRSGRIVPYWEVEAAASAARVCLRGGCFCNPGAAEAALDLDRPAARACLNRLGAQFTPERFATCLGAAVGALRVSFGAATRRLDVDRALAMIAAFAAPAPRPGVARAGARRRPLRS